MALFTSALRKEGLTAAADETADACRIICLLGVDDRTQLKAALSSIFAKTREEQITFSRVFDGFFISEEAMRLQAKEQLEREQKLEMKKSEAEASLREQGVPTALTDEQLETYVLMPGEARERLRRLTDTYKKSLGKEPKLFTEFIHSVFTRTLLEQQMKLEDAGTGGRAADPEIGILYRDISEFKDAEIPKAAMMIRTISARINRERSSKKKAAGHSGALDFRRTIRKSLQSGGHFHQLVYRRKHAKKHRLVILCDVSASMICFSEFALRFIEELHKSSADSSVWLFSETAKRADPFDLENMDLFRSYVRKTGLYGKGTDLGTALGTLLSAKPAELTSSATLLILSDAKTIDQKRAVKALLAARSKAGQVIWLNPIPGNRWKYLNSTQTFAALCTMVSCSTLDSLASACRKLTLD